MLSRALKWLVLDEGALRRSLLIGGLVALAEFEAVFIAATIDDNWWLEEPAIGLLQHPGIPVIIVADFALIALVTTIVRRFSMLAKKLPVLQQASNRRYLRRAVGRASGWAPSRVRMRHRLGAKICGRDRPIAGA